MSSIAHTNERGDIFSSPTFACLLGYVCGNSLQSRTVESPNSNDILSEQEVGRDSAVIVATGYGLDHGVVGVRVPVG
jgi:hypothetical protein